MNAFEESMGVVFHVGHAGRGPVVHHKERFWPGDVVSDITLIYALTGSSV